MKARSSSSATHHITEGIFAAEKGLENLVRIAAELIRMRETRMTAGGKTASATRTTRTGAAAAFETFLAVFVVDLQRGGREGGRREGGERREREEREKRERERERERER